MKLIQLRYYCGVVEHGGFIAASRELNVVQPALSRQISDLEKQLGSTLLLRGPGGTEMTDSGQKFYIHAKAILEKIEIAQADMQTNSELLEGDISIALPVGMASQLASAIVQDVTLHHPRISIQIEDGLGYQAGQAVDSAKVDFAILANVGNLKNVTFEPVLEESLFLFSKRDEPSPNTRDIDLIDLQNIDLIMPNRKVHVRRNLENAMLAKGGSVTVRYEQQSLLTIRSMVRAGIGATVLNWPSMSDLWYSGEVDGRKISNPSLSRTVCLAIPNTRPLSKSAKAVYDIVRQTLLNEVNKGNWKSGQVVENPQSSAPLEPQ